MTDLGTTTEVHTGTSEAAVAPTARRPTGASSRRGIVISGLAVGAMLFVFQAQELWQDAIGLPDLPGAELRALIFGAIVVLGFAFPDPVASLAAGLAGFAAVLAALALTGDLEDAFPEGRGFDLRWLEMIALPAGAHVIGVAARRLVSPRHGVSRA